MNKRYEEGSENSDTNTLDQMESYIDALEMYAEQAKIFSENGVQYYKDLYNFGMHVTYSTRAYIALNDTENKKLIKAASIKSLSHMAVLRDHLLNCPEDNRDSKIIMNIIDSVISLMRAN